MPAAVAVFLLALPCAAQTPDAAAYTPSLTFDVASIREAKPDFTAGFNVSFENPRHTSSLKLTNNSVYNLFEVAYGISDYQLSGMPDWARRAVYTIEAKSDPATDEKLGRLTDKQAALEKQHMLQALLAERFHLTMHWETKDHAIYALVVANPKNGPKIPPTANAAPSAEDVKYWGDRPVPPIYQRGSNAAGRRGYEYVCHACSMGELAGTLAPEMGTAVEDRTGLTGRYDFVLQYNGRSPSHDNEDPKVFPAMTDALPDELGLKLEGAHGQVPLLVIDTLEKASEN